MGKGKGLIVGSFFFLKPFNSVLEFKNVRFGFFNQLFRKFKFKISNNMCYLVSNFCKNIFKKKKKLKSLFKKLIKINNNCFEELIKRGIKPKPIILKIFFNLLLKKNKKHITNLIVKTTFTIK